jgi:predicted transcriptional regulator of viral defense system
VLKLTDLILDKIPYDSFSDSELASVIDGTPNRRHQLIKRALAAKELIQIKRGLYQLAPRYERKGVHPFQLAERIYGPSYISFESALSYHGLIPESVYTITSATFKQSREFQTPAGIFSYTHIPKESFPLSIKRIEENGHIFLMATPLKAIADYFYSKRPEWEGLESISKSLRIDPENLIFNREEIDAIKEAQKNARTARFFDKIRAELKKRKSR